MTERPLSPREQEALSAWRESGGDRRRMEHLLGLSRSRSAALIAQIEQKLRVPRASLLN